MADAADVRAAREDLAAAAEGLAARGPSSCAEGVARLLDELRAPTSARREALGRALSEATGLHPDTVARGLELALRDWSGDALRALIETEMRGPQIARGFETTSVLLAGVIPMPSLLSLLLPLAVGSPVLARPGRHDPVTAPWLREALCDHDEELARALACVPFDHADEQALADFLDVPCVVATGSDDTVRAISARVAPRTRLIRYGHRTSVAAVGLDAEDPEWTEAARGIARDVALWDQLGCLSPIALFVRGEGDVPSAVREALVAAFEEAAEDLPRGAVPTHAAAQLAQERATAEMRGAAGGPVGVHLAPEWTLVFEADVEPRPAPGYRILRVVPVANSEALAKALRPHAPHLAAIGHAGLDEAWRQAVLAAGPSRLCALGRMQAPPLDWPHDGESPLRPLLRFTGVE